MTGPLGPRQAAVLEHLAAHPGLTAGELERFFGLRHSLLQTLHRLEEQALVVAVTAYEPDRAGGWPAGTLRLPEPSAAPPGPGSGCRPTPPGTRHRCPARPPRPPVPSPPPGPADSDAGARRRGVQGR